MAQVVEIWTRTRVYCMVNTMAADTIGISGHGDDQIISFRGYPAKRALSAMRKHGG